MHVRELVRNSSSVRLLLLPDEVNLVYRVMRGQPQVPRVMLDVGAHIGSTLRWFAADGWQVYAFEPDAKNRAKLETAARAWPNVRIDVRALSNRIEQNVAFFSSSTSTGVSALAPFDPAHVQSGTVSTTTLEAACDEYALREIGVLKIDVEGFDLHVLQGLAWSKLAPQAVICEFEDAKTNALGYGFHDLARYLVEHGYSVLVSEWYPVVRYGVSHRWRSLTRYPCELRDARCFGNLIGFRDQRHAAAALRLAQPFESVWRAVSRVRSSLAAHS